MKLPFQELGSGPPVILLHGFPLSRTMWQPNVGAIADAGFRVITPDFPGFGENTSFADINTMEDMAKGVAELLNSLKIERAIIGGLSMGGYVTFALYAIHPELFAGLILCDTTSVADTDEKRKGRFELMEKIERQGSQALVENMLPNLIADSTKENDQELVAELERTFTAVNPKAAIAALRGMAARADHTNRLGDIIVPTILVFGEHDKVTNLDAARMMNRAIAGSKLVVIENAGHFSNQEQPATFNDAIVDLLKSVEV